MSELAARLGVADEQASGQVDRLVELGLARAPRRCRRPPPGDRRATRPRTEHASACASSTTTRCATCSSGSADDEPPSSAPSRSSTGRRRPGRPPGGRPGKESSMSRLTEFAVNKRSVTLCWPAALFIAGISAWGSLKQELLPDIEFPVVTVVAPYPGAGDAGRRRPGRQADRARHLRRAAARDRPVDLGQLDRARHRPVRVRHGRQGASPRSRRTSPTPACPAPSSRPLGPQHQRVAGDHRVDRGQRARTAWPRPPRSPGPRSCRRSPPSRASPRPT